jgi:hypothetical protein
MADPKTGDEERRRLRLRAAGTIIGIGLAACLGVAVAQAQFDRLTALTPVLGVAAIVAGMSVARVGGRASISASFIVVLLAAAFLGPATACVVGAISEATAARRLRTAPFAVSFNLLGVLVPALVAANMIRAIGLGRSDSASFYLVVLGAAVTYLAINFVIVATFQQLYRGDRVLTVETFKEYTPSQALNVALAVAGASIYVKLGLSGILFALAAVFARAAVPSSTSRSPGECSPVCCARSTRETSGLRAMLQACRVSRATWPPPSGCPRSSAS